MSILQRDLVSGRKTGGGAQGWDPVRQRWVGSDEDNSEPRTAMAPESLILRPWTQGDLGDYVALLDDPEVWRYLPEAYPDPLTHDLAAQMIELSNSATHHIVRAALLHGQPVGQVRLAFAPGAAGRETGEIGYWLGRRWQGQGIGPAMVAQFSAYCFALLPDLRSQWARVHRDNHASTRVLERCGFRRADTDPDLPEFIRFLRFAPVS